MEYRGFEIIDDAGNVQVMDEAYDLTWQKAHSLSGDGDFSADLLAIEPAQGQKIEVVPLIWNGGASTGELVADHNPNQIERFRGVGRVHEFSFDLTGPRKNFGLEVFDAEGNTTFTTNLLSIDIKLSYSTGDYRKTMADNGGEYITKQFVGSGAVGVVVLGHPHTLKENSRGHLDAYTVSFTREGQYIVAREAKTYDTWMPVGFLSFKYRSFLGLRFLIVDLKGF